MNLPPKFATTNALLGSTFRGIATAILNEFDFSVLSVFSVVNAFLYPAGAMFAARQKGAQ
jgi:hypothetical protein